MNESSDQVRVEILQVVLERKVERVTGRECPTFRRPRFDFVFFFLFLVFSEAAGKLFCPRTFSLQAEAVR